MQAAPHRRAPRAGLMLVIVVLLAAAALRLWELNGASVWHDEAWSIRAIRDPIGTPDDNTPPLYYGVHHLLYLGAGDSAFALRYGSLLIDLLTIAAGAALARRWANWDAAVLVALLLALSPLLWAYAREIRAYVMVPLLTLTLLGLADRLLRSWTRFPWRILAAVLLAELALLYTHNLSTTVVGWLNVVIIVAWASAQQWRALGVWIASQGLALLLYLPWGLGQSPSGTPLNTPPALEPALPWNIWRAYFAPVSALIGDKIALDLISALFALAAAVALVALLVRGRTRRAMLVISQALLLPIFATGLLWLAHIDFHPRYYIAGVPATLLLIALGVNRLPEAAGLRPAAFAGAIGLAAAGAAASLTAVLDEPPYQHDDFRALAAYYASLPADALIVIPYGWEPALEAYYADRLGVRAEIVGVPLHSSAEDAIAQINAALADRALPAQVELLTWYQLPADVRGMYPCLLEAAGGPPAASLTVQGLTTTAYAIAEPLALAPVADAGADYGRLTLDSAALNAAQSVCARTTWTLDAATDADWRVAAQLVTTDPPGWTLDRSDADIRQDDQTPTSDWSAGEAGAAFSLLRFPDGAPPGDYPIRLTVYSSAAPNGLDALLDGTPSGRSLTVATVQPEGTTDAAPPDTPPVVELAAGVQLAGVEVAGESASPGQELRITLQWVAPDNCCDGGPWTGAMLTLRGADWAQSQPVAAYAGYSLNWHAFHIPAKASDSADLVLEAPDAAPVTLATIPITATDRLLSPPTYAQPIGAPFPGVGVLEGFTLDEVTVSVGEPLRLTLVWQATATPERAYTVFTHLLDESGRYLGGHDGPPADGARPTTGWVAGEYVVDAHALTLEDTTYRGPAQIEVGLYDPETGARVSLDSGADRILLPITITVQ